MEWYNIIAIIVGALGGTAGFVGLYKAKSEKTSIDIDNMQEMLSEAHKMYDSARAEKNEVINEYNSYKKEIAGYIKQFKDRFSAVEKRLEKTEKNMFKITAAVYQGYRCQYPPATSDCPVIKAFELQNCCDCAANINEGQQEV